MHILTNIIVSFPRYRMWIIITAYKNNQRNVAHDNI